MPSRAVMTLPLPSGDAAHVTSYGFDAGAGRLAVRLLLLLLPAGGVRCRVVSLKLPDSRRDRRRGSCVFTFKQWGLRTQS